MNATQTLTYTPRTDTFALTTRDAYGEHVALFTAPRGARMNVCGVDCDALRSLAERHTNEEIEHAH